MNHLPYQFLKWIPVQGEKHLGIAVVRFEGRFIFRFKIMPSDKGGLWACTASLKTGVFNGKDKYDAAFELDSSYEKEELLSFVCDNVAAQMRSPDPIKNHIVNVFNSTPIKNTLQATSARPVQNEYQQASFAETNDDVPF